LDVNDSEKRIKNMNTKYTVVIAIVVIAILIGAVAAYIYFSAPAEEAAPVSLTGSGATFPQPFLNATITNILRSNQWFRLTIKAAVEKESLILRSC
jgi:ABC-type phosphate transport system substrate-binding protein